MVDDAAGYHQAGVEGAASDSSERVPCSYSQISAIHSGRDEGGCIGGVQGGVRSSNQSQKL